MSAINLFPTTIWQDPATPTNYDPVQLEVQAALKHIKDNNDLENVSYIYRDAGERKTDYYTEGHFISDQLIEKHGMENLEARIYEAVDRYARFVEWTALAAEPDPVIPNTAKGKWKIMNSWINIAEKNVSHDFHAHPGYTIAGVYYFRVSDEQGGISWNNPNPLIYNAGFPEGRTSPQCIEFIPEDGDILLFPAWLQHGTHKNTTDEERISIAFNVNYIPSEIK
jgi:uncharacterized protein (TIGR02466 family)